MSELNNKNIELIKKQLEQILKKQEEFEKRLEEIEKDLYLDNDYDLEIVCPYCNYSFILDADETNTEINCPECNNVIEIDWEGESLEDDECSCCGHNCVDKKKDKNKSEEDQPEEDDM